MKDNVIDFTGITKNDLDPDKILKEAIGKMDGCVIIGYDKEDSDQEVFISSYGDMSTVLWLLKRMEHMIIKDEE
jgi:hypothetical protein